MDFEFIETDIFTRQIQILTEEEYAKLQCFLIQHPESGALIQGAKGIRKLRWSDGGKGKRGGIRVLYYGYLIDRQIFLLYVFKKSEQSDLSKAQLSVLAAYVKTYLKD